MAKQVRDVIVIGAGLSGLSAAKLLHENGLDVIVLEARDRVGGRTLTEHNENVKYVDLGGAYVGPTQNRILRLADEFGIKTFLTNEEQDLIYFTKGKTRRFHGAFPPMGGLLPFLDLNNFFRLMDNMGEEIPVDAPWKAPHAEEWDQQTMQEFINKHVWTKELYTAATQFVTVNVTSEPYECSLLWFLWYVKLCGGTTRINAAENGAQERKFIGGSQQISKCIASKIGKDAVLLERPVCHIRQEKDMVTATDINGGKYSARYIIIAAPLSLQNKITYDPPLPSLRNQLIQRVPMGSVIKVFVYYKRPFWREKGFCGSSAIDDEDALVEFTLDDVKADGTYPAIMGFILASKARKYVDLSKEERKQRICRLYAKVFESDEALTPVHYEEKNWLEEQWSGGCYTAMMPPGFLTNYGREIRKPVGRLYFAGTETATQWSGYMDGAVQAGERAAREILHTIGRIEEKDIWQDEPENKNVRARDFESTFLERNLPSVGGFLTSVGFVSLATAAGAAAYFYLQHKK